VQQAHDTHADLDAVRNRVQQLKHEAQDGGVLDEIVGEHRVRRDLGLELDADANLALALERDGLVLDRVRLACSQPRSVGVCLSLSRVSVVEW